MTNDNTTTKYPFTAADIAALRDDQRLSWAKVAAALDLGSPGAARRAYTALVRPHTDSVLPGRLPGTAKVTPVHLVDADLATITEAIVGRTILVERKGGKHEPIAVAKVTSVKDGTVNLHDGSKSRSVAAAAIVGVQ